MNHNTNLRAAAEWALMLDLARALVEVRCLDANARSAVDRFGWPERGTLAEVLRSEVECRCRASEHGLAGALRARGIDPGHTADDASSCVREITARYYEAP